MSSSAIENVVIGLLRQCYTRPKCQAIRVAPSLGLHELPSHITSPARHLHAYTTSANRLQNPHNGNGHIGGRKAFQSTSAREAQGSEQPVERIAVLGGGITGLAAAHYLAKEKPNASITLIEGSDRLGGWLRSTSIDVGDGKVIFESGPRTLRAGAISSLATLDLVSRLDLQDQLIITDQSSPAARSRFIYYPDRLVRMPGPGQGIYNILWSLLTEPVFEGVISSAIKEHRQPPRPSNLEDESVASFVERRLGAVVGNNLLSAVLHGIYGGDIHQLSARSILGNLWDAERRHGSISADRWAKITKEPIYPAKVMEFANAIDPNIPKGLKDALSTASVFTFRGGMETLVKGLERDLRSRSNVHIALNKHIKSIEYDGQQDLVKITSQTNNPIKPFTTVISTLSASNLAKISAAPLPSLADQKAVTVMTVNLFYKDPFLLDEPGFGYLIPRAVPFEQNPECALGVVFDSFSAIGQDTTEGTKMTVMLGGHWWSQFTSSDYPTEEEGLSMAKEIVRRHLKIKVEPDAWKSSLHRDCIPQYTVGHEQRLKKANSELIQGFRGRVRVAGASYGGVGVNDCVKAAWEVVRGVVGWSGTGVKTGLEDFGYDTKMVVPTRNKQQ